MGTHAITVRIVKNGIAIQHPLRVVVEVGTLGDVVDLLITAGRHNGDIGIGIAHVGDQGYGEPFAVGRPFIANATIMLCTIGDLTHFLGFYVIDFQYITILNKSNFLAIG